MSDVENARLKLLNEVEKRFAESAKLDTSNELQSLSKLLDFSSLADLSTARIARAPESPLLMNLNENLAREFCKRLNEMIREFDLTLNSEFEVGAQLASFSNSIIHLESIGYSGPSLICIRGFFENGAPVELVQHVTQINILLMKLPRLKPDEDKVAFGFHASTVENGDSIDG